MVLFLFLVEEGRGGVCWGEGVAFEKVVIPGSHCVFYFKELKETCPALLVALSSRKH